MRYTLAVSAGSIVWNCRSHIPGVEMSETVTVPIWLAIIVLMLAALWILGQLLMPGVRWYIHKRLSRTAEELNIRLRLKIKPFKLTRRQTLIDRLRYDSEVLKAAEEKAEAEEMPREAVAAEVKGYAREIVPAFNAYFYFRFGCWLARKIAQSLYRVRLGFVDDESLAKIPEDACVVFLINHRSNTDYILVSYLAASRTALSYAVGEWARIWPLQTLLKAMGAYFVRRSSRNPLYRKVLERYVHMATQSGMVQALFPEGGLSRDGLLLPPRLGLLSYMLKSFDPEGRRDLVFIPVGLNYDRVLEDRSLLLMDRSDVEPKGGWLTFITTFKFLMHNVGLMFRKQWHRLGYAIVNFGSPISMKEYLAEHNLDFRELDRDQLFSEVEVLGDLAMKAIGEVIPVTPVALVSMVFERRIGEKMSELELKAEAHELIKELERAGAHIYIPRSSQDYAITVGLRMLTLRHIVEETDGLFRTREDEIPLLKYYSNSIAHFLA